MALDQLRAAVHEFHETGGLRPRCVEWQPVDGWCTSPVDERMLPSSSSAP
ncbi:Imm1 family immunity protein [Streptoalloteichus tenebrarius]